MAYEAGESSRVRDEAGESSRGHDEAGESSRGHGEAASQWRVLFMIMVFLSNPDKGISLGRQVLLSLFCMINSYTSFFRGDFTMQYLFCYSTAGEVVPSGEPEVGVVTFPARSQPEWVSGGSVCGRRLGGTRRGRGRAWGSLSRTSPISESFEVVFCIYRWWYLQSRRFTS